MFIIITLQFVHTVRRWIQHRPCCTNPSAYSMAESGILGREYWCCRCGHDVTKIRKKITLRYLIIPPVLLGNNASIVIWKKNNIKYILFYSTIYRLFIILCKTTFDTIFNGFRNHINCKTYFYQINVWMPSVSLIQWRGEVKYFIRKLFFE